MTSFVTAYLIVWAFVAAYVLRLRADQQRLTRRIQALEDLLNEGARECRPVRAA